MTLNPIWEEENKKKKRLKAIVINCRDENNSVALKSMILFSSKRF